MECARLSWSQAAVGEQRDERGVTVVELSSERLYRGRRERPDLVLHRRLRSPYGADRIDSDQAGVHRRLEDRREYTTRLRQRGVTCGKLGGLPLRDHWRRQRVKRQVP